MNCTQIVRRFPGNRSLATILSEIVPGPMMDDFADQVLLIVGVLLRMLDVEIFDRDALLFRHDIASRSSFGMYGRNPWQPGHFSQSTSSVLPCLMMSMSKSALQTEQCW
jgi:hypothetical protein